MMILQCGPTPQCKYTRASTRSKLFLNAQSHVRRNANRCFHLRIEKQQSKSQLFPAPGCHWSLTRVSRIRQCCLRSMGTGRQAASGTRAHPGLRSSAPPGRKEHIVTVPRVSFAFGELHPWLQPSAPPGPQAWVAWASTLARVSYVGVDP